MVGSTRSILLELFFFAVLLVVRFRRLFRVTSGVKCVSSGYMGMVSRLLVLSSLMVPCGFTMVASSVGVMILRFLVVFGRFL